MYAILWIVSLSAWPFLLADVSSEDSVETTLKALKDKLLLDYDKLVRPTNGKENATHVIFSISPKYIVNVDEDRSLFTLDSYVYMGWTDVRLSWNSTEYRTADLKLPIDIVWRPDLVVWNSHSFMMAPYDDTPVYIWDTGRVHWSTSATTTTYCKVAESDDVTCKMVIGSWAHTGWDLNLTTPGTTVPTWALKDSNPRWKLKKEEASFERKVEMYSCCEEPFYSVIVSFPMTRKPAHQLRAVLSPCIAITSLMLTLIWIPPRQYLLRASLGAILFLTLNLLVLYVEMTAETSWSAKEAASLIKTTSIVLSIVIVLQVVTTRLSLCAGPQGPHPRLLRWVSGPPFHYSWIQTPSGYDTMQLKQQEEIESSSMKEWGLVATAIDRTMFAVCLPTMALFLFIG